jgi:hypothetical protein
MLAEGLMAIVLSGDTLTLTQGPPQIPASGSVFASTKVPSQALAQPEFTNLKVHGSSTVQIHN